MNYELVMCEVGLEIYERMDEKMRVGKLAEVEHRELVQHRAGCEVCSKVGITG